MNEQSLNELRTRVDRINREILSLVRQRGEVVLEIAQLKQHLGLQGFDPRREDEMLRELTAEVSPFEPDQVREIFKTIFRSSLDLQEGRRQQALNVRRKDLLPEGGIRIGETGVTIGAGRPVLFAGPCSVETVDQMDRIAAFVAGLPGEKVLRAGAFKPRTNPYSFQGLREEGLRILEDSARRHGLPTVTEVLDTGTLDVVAEHADMLQVGARNMYNTELLKALGRLRKPVLLKRGFMATVEELLLAAEYILAQGNHAVVLCERGIRTFETSTRNTLDIASMALLKTQTSLPVIVDLSHALGRKDILLPCGRAALAAGADGLMIEVHPYPDQALSDGSQQLDLPGCAELVAGLGL
jgi:3-deoxy-7-phosphoheptulonate synthase/chorismate mutase